MENEEIYIFDESSPLLESTARGHIFFHDDRTATLTPTYLVELPEYTTNAPVPPKALLEKRRRSTRGTSIINPQLQLELTEEEQEEPLEYFMTRNLTNYRKSVLVKDPDETHGIITAENRDSETKFEIVEPLKVLRPEKVPSTYPPSAYLENNVEQRGDATAKEISNIEQLSATNNNSYIPQEENKSLNSGRDSNRTSNLTLKKEITREIPANAFSEVEQKSPFTYGKLDLSTQPRLKITVMLIESEEDLGSKHSRDTLQNNFVDEYKDDSYEYKDDSQSLFADSDHSNIHNAEKQNGKSDQQTGPVTKFEVIEQKSSNLPHNRTQEVQLQQRQNPFCADLKGSSIEVCFHDSQLIDKSRKSIQANSGQLNSLGDSVCKCSNPESFNDDTKRQIMKHDKPTKQVIYSKRYHVKLLKMEEQGKWFDMFLVLDKCDVDMKYKGPIKITTNYSINKYKL